MEGEVCGRGCGDGAAPVDAAMARWRRLMAACCRRQRRDALVGDKAAGRRSSGAGARTAARTHCIHASCTRTVCAACGNVVSGAARCRPRRGGHRGRRSARCCCRRLRLLSSRARCVVVALTAVLPAEADREGTQRMQCLPASMTHARTGGGPRCPCGYRGSPPSDDATAMLRWNGLAVRESGVNDVRRCCVALCEITC